MITRIPLRHKQEVKVPLDLQAYLWDHPTGMAPLEKLLLRTFRYCSFEQLKAIYRQYPEECFDTIQRHHDIKRGVRYWINYWHGKIA
jgi:hypothetical protein